MNTDFKFDEKLIENRKYWLKKLSDIPEKTSLKQDYMLIDNSFEERKSSPVIISGDLLEKLDNLTKGKDFLLYTTLVAVLNICLYKYTGNERIIIGSPVLKKEDGSDSEGDLIGVINAIDSSLTFRDFLLNVRKNLLEDYERQDYPSSELIRDLGLSASDGNCPLFDIAILLTDIHRELSDTKTNITMRFTKAGDVLRGQVEYSNLISEETITAFISHFINVLKGALENTNSKISDLTIFSEEELNKILIEWNKTEVPYDKSKCIHQLFEEQVRKTPNKVAVTCGSNRITYLELNQKANKLAKHLRKMGVKANSLVGICLKPSIEMVVGLFGILKAGGAYVPVDSKYPKDRINYMLSDAEPVVLLTQNSLAELLSEINLKKLFIDADWNRIENEDIQDPDFEDISPDNMAYIIYTSGSTGKPKGSGVFQRGWNNLLNWFIKEFSINSKDKVILISSFSFDLTQKNVFAPLITGGELHLPAMEYYDPSFLMQYVFDNGISLLNCTPSAFYPFVDLDDSFKKLSSLRCLFLGGEPISLSRLSKWVESEYFKANIVNTYGPTECTDICCFYTIKESDYKNAELVPIGRPVYNTRLYILNKNNDLMPPGTIGELCIAGDGVGAGYIRDAELTKQKFIRNPFSEEEELLYKTGDLVYYLPDGNIQYVGRIDHQVKIRGFRIELGEIEEVIKQHSGVKEAVVIVRESAQDNLKLEAYIVVDQEKAPVVKKLMGLEREGVNSKQSTYELPNGMTVFHLNKSETEFVYREIFEEQTYLKGGITLNDGSTIMDVGANIGMFTLFAARECKNANIYAFEPIEPVFKVLKQNVELYDIDVKLFNCGLSEVSRMEEITYYPNVSIMSGRYADSKEDHENIKLAILHEMQENGNKSEISEQEIDELVEERLRSEIYNCELKTISEVIEENGIERIDLLKIDVEKSELDILMGISEEHWGRIFQIVLELHDINGRLQEVKSLLENKGYQVSYLKDSKLEDNEIYNLYAVSTGKGASINKEEVEGSSVSMKWCSVKKLSDDIISYAKSRLPDYMIPSDFILIDSIPLNPNGKVDRDALLEYGKNYVDVESNIAAPTNPLEETIAKIWAEVLDLKEVGIDDNFLQLGGHSLLATAIISRLRKIYKVEVPIYQFFENPTIRELALVFKELIKE